MLSQIYTLFNADFSFIESKKDKSIAKATARDIWLVLTFSITYFLYFLLFHSWSTEHIILLFGIVTLVFSYFINFTSYSKAVRFLPFFISYINIFWGSGAFGYHSQIHLLFLLVFIDIFLNIRRLERKTFVFLFSTPLVLTTILFIYDFDIFTTQISKDNNTITTLAYLSQFHVLVGTILFLNIYLINTRYQKKKLLSTQRELSNLLLESEKLNKDLKKSQEELSKAGMFQNKIFENSYDAILLADAQDSTIIKCNDKAVELFGFSHRDELIGRKGTSLQKRMFSEAELEEIIYTLKVAKKTWTSDLEYHDGKGDCFWGSLAISEIEIDGEPFHLVRVINISEKKEQERIINDLKNYYLTTLEYQQGLNFRYIKDEKGFKITLARGKFLEKFGLSKEDTENKLLRQLFSDKEYELREKYYQKAWQGESCFYEAKVPGKEIWYLVYLNPIIEDGEVKEVIGSSVDISDIKKKDQLLIKQNEELQKLNHALDRFVYSASHDLRAPIASCLGLIDIAKKENEAEIIHQYLALKEKSLNRLDKFIGDILDYSRNTRLPVKCENIDLRQLVHEVFDNYSYTEQFKDITKEIIIEGEAEFVSDSYRLNVIFNNLLSNAIRYYNPFIAAPFIKVEAEIVPDKCQITVSDNGLGIDKNHIHKIFDMFYRATDKLSGSGLGLYIVKEHIEKLGGEISVSSSLGKGTTFTIVLPNFLHSNLEDINGEVAVEENSIKEN